MWMRRWQEIPVDDHDERAAGQSARASDGAADERERAARQRARACYTDCAVGTAVLAARRRHQCKTTGLRFLERDEPWVLLLVAAVMSLVLFGISR